MRIDLTENGGPVAVRLAHSAALGLAATRLVGVTPLPGDGVWAVEPRTHVGVAQIGEVELWIRPKTPIRRVFFLLGYARTLDGWRDEDVSVAEDADLLPAVAAAFARQALRATAQGLIQGYRVREDTSPVLRGRIRSEDQLRRRFGLPIPLEIRYDEYTVDIAENQLLRSATDALLRLPGVGDVPRRSLRRLQRLLADITRLPRGVGVLPRWHPSRLNARYQPALRLAELILRAGSVEHADGTVVVNGFMLNMATVFESFVATTLGEALSAVGGRCVAQDTHWRLDAERTVSLRPDLVWYPTASNVPGAVVDVKYKIEQPSGYPNADLYQMLAYCTRLGLTQGHLVYAEGGPRTHMRVEATELTLMQHAIDLDTGPSALLAQIGRVAEFIAAGWASDVPADLIRASS